MKNNKYVVYNIVALIAFISTLSAFYFYYGQSVFYDEKIRTVSLIASLQFFITLNYAAYLNK